MANPKSLLTHLARKKTEWKQHKILSKEIFKNILLLNKMNQLKLT